MREDDELDQVARAQRDRAAFAPLYDRYVPVVYHYCHRLLGQRDAAEDATSETFTKALAQLHRFQPRAGSRSFRGWLFTIAHHAAMDILRRRPALPLAEGWEGIDPSQLPDEQLIAHESARDLHAALQDLNDDQRAVMYLRLAGLTGVEIAEVMHRTPQAIKSLQFRAIAQLRLRLRDETRGNHAARS